MDEVVNPNDVRMRQFQAPLGLMFQLIQQRSILDHQVGKEFQRNLEFQFFVARQPHNPHSAAAKDFEQPEATKYDLSAGGIQRRLEKTTRATSLRRVRRDFGSALLANSDQRGHFGSRLRAPLFYCAKFYQKLRGITHQNRRRAIRLHFALISHSYRYSGIKPEKG